MLPLVKQYFLKQSKLWDIYVVLGLALLFFWLQARHLHNAALPVSDEGEHVDAGRRMFEGYLPYKDFYYQHPPFFALFLGASLRLFGGMFPVRVLFLFLNVFSVLPLYAVLKKIGGHRTAGIIAITFYLTYHQMVAHDFRFAAIRQFANICFIGFLYWGIVKHEERYSIYAQGAFAILTTMTLLPMAFNLFFASLACIFTEAAAKRPTVFWRYLGIGIGAAIGIVFSIPDSAQSGSIDFVSPPWRHRQYPEKTAAPAAMERPQHIVLLSEHWVASLQHPINSAHQDLCLHDDLYDCDGPHSP